MVNLCLKILLSDKKIIIIISFKATKEDTYVHRLNETSQFENIMCCVMLITG